jgi:hypothetical protein
MKVVGILSPQQSLDVSERRPCVNDAALKTMPVDCIEGEVEVHFVPVKKITAPADLDSRLNQLGYRLVSPLTLLAVNRLDQGFADRFPNATQWKHSDGNFYCLAFDRDNRTDNRRRVVVDQIVYSYSTDWYHGCVLI